ncbi:hypothetical protein [Streptomyces sp. NPDC056463]|uniref:hypothetical protein n=1 Tax=Streptomyces sp. NPDC056463 TaxID=3345827 RepID=UPI00367F6F69
MLRDRQMRDLLGPVAAVALIAQLNGDLPVPSISFEAIFDGGRELGMGVRLHLHHPDHGAYERWAHLIGSDNPDSHTDFTPTTRGNVIRRTFGAYADIPVEVIAYVPPAQPAVVSHLALALDGSAA